MAARKKATKKKATKKKATKKKATKKKATKKKATKKKATKKKATKKKATKKKAGRKTAARTSGGKKLEAVYVGMDHPLAMANGCTYRHRLVAWNKGKLKNPSHVVSLETGKVYPSIREMHAAHRKARARQRK